ncbi:MAG: hypothetical protein GXO26_05915 [Crenarchaeota archaeon]|nr:hypothetical protein [Thermoproteota archaeon]
MRKLILEEVLISVLLSSILSLLVILFTFMYMSPPLGISFSALFQPQGALGNCIRFGAGLSPILGESSYNTFIEFVSSISTITINKVYFCISMKIRHYVANFVTLRLFPIAMLLASVVQAIVLRIFNPRNLIQITVALGPIRFGASYVFWTMISALIISIVSLCPALVMPLTFNRLALIVSYFDSLFIPLLLSLTGALALGSEVASLSIAVLLFVWFVSNPLSFARILDPMLIVSASIIELESSFLRLVAYGIIVNITLIVISLTLSYRGAGK